MPPRTTVKLPAIVQGDPDGVPVILLHGLSDSARSYETVLLHLPNSIRAYALTLRGHGDASKPATGYGSAHLAADVVEFMDSRMIEEAVIVGHSMGSWVAERIAADHPDRVLGVVLAGAFATCARDDMRALLGEFSAQPERVDPRWIRAFQESTIERPVQAAFF